MFFEVGMRRLVVVEAGELGDAAHTERAMIRRLLTDMDSEQCTERHGYNVAVTTLEDVSEGKIRPGSGAVAFWVGFKCIVLRLIRNEITEVEVTQVMHNGFLAALGPAKIFVPRKQMGRFQFWAGPSLEFNEWRDSQGPAITPGSLVRLKVAAVRWEPKTRTMMTVGTVNGILLGPVQTTSPAP